MDLVQDRVQWQVFLLVVFEISGSVHFTLSVDNNCRNRSISASLPNSALEGLLYHNQTHILECTYGVQVLFFPHCNLKIYMAITDKNYCLIFIYYMYLFTAIGLLPGGSGYFTCKQNMKLVTTRFKSGGLREKHVVATWNVGNHLSICL